MGGSVGVFELIHKDRARAHTEPKSAVLRLMVSHGWSIRSPTTDTPQGERGVCGGMRLISQTPKMKEENIGCVGVSPNVRMPVKLRAVLVLHPLCTVGCNSPNIAQRHALPSKGLQIKHLCFRIAFSSPVQRLV